MTSKQNILDEIRKNVRHDIEMPDIDAIVPVQYEDSLSKFVEMVEFVGGHAVMLEPGEDINDAIHRNYPEAKVVASSLPYIKADKDPDMVQDAGELADVDLGVLEGRVAVAENGCVWIPQTMKERAVMFISQCLVIIVDRNDIVSNMHKAYEMVSSTEYLYGCFISGPSKTADIAQALVMGAQAARDVTVIIR